MDKKNERKFRMDKRLTIFLASCLLALFGEGYTNLVDCIGIRFTAANVISLPDSDNSSPDCAVMGFFRGIISGDYRRYLQAMSDELRINECGSAELDSLAGGVTNDFRRLVGAMGYTNHMILACSSLQTNGVAHVSAKVRSACIKMTKTSYLQFTLNRFCSEWRIVSWDVEEN